MDKKSVKTAKAVWLVVMLMMALPSRGQREGRFEQLGPMLPTPNTFRTSSGSPGPAYWQQKADYEIAVELDDDHQRISGTEKVTYHNQAPEPLTYLWLQLDQNIVEKNNLTDKTEPSALGGLPSALDVARMVNLIDLEGGYEIKDVRDASGKPLPFTINHTMMRIDLPAPLDPGGVFIFTMEWSFHIVDRMKSDQRSGMEFFPGDGNYVYTIAQFFPRMCVFDDYEGWQNKQYLGTGEFALPFGDYRVRITVPADHIVSATGVLHNPAEVLSRTERDRFEQARTAFDKPVFIVNEQEAISKEQSKSSQKKTWEFHADHVRDFAFASSRKFIWEAMSVRTGSTTPLVMSFYPKEGNPLWQKDATLAGKNALEVYSKYTFDYPYPVANIIHTASIGMEYPMICFNYGRPAQNGTYSEATRQRMIGVIIHEVGHNFFPMIVNSDERQCTWMDEGINSFLQLLTETERYPGLDWSESRGQPAALVPYMIAQQESHRPLMTNPEQVLELGPEQYTKAATALSILRETVMGHELFDMAFKTYARRWAFKHPKPADFFRTMEDASAVDLDWFWRGWFYTTDVVDQSIDEVKWYRLKKDPASAESKDLGSPGSVGASQKSGNNNLAGSPLELRVLPTDETEYLEFLSRIDDREIIGSMESKNFYEVTLSNRGGLVMPVILQWNYKDGTMEIERIPAEIWRTNERAVTKVFMKDKEVADVVIDPFRETSDANTDNNSYPQKQQPSRFDQFREKRTQ